MEHGVDAHDVLALEVGEHRSIVERTKRLLRAVAALHLRQLADAADELVRAGRSVAGLARLLADEARRVEVLPATEESTKELHLVDRRSRSISRRLGGLRVGGRFASCVPLREVGAERTQARLGFGVLGLQPVEVRFLLGDGLHECVSRRGTVRCRTSAVRSGGPRPIHGRPIAARPGGTLFATNATS